jgi:hypothetical protein
VAEVTQRESGQEQSDDLADELETALQRVNRIRVEHGADPLYELPQAQPASVPGSVCVLQEAFADLGVSTVDYYFLVGKGVRIEHGLSWFVRRFDAGAYPQLVAAPRPGP